MQLMVVTVVMHHKCFYLVPCNCSMAIDSETLQSLRMMTTQWQTFNFFFIPSVNGK